MKWCGLIPARKGSKGIPQKNRVLVGGQELIRYTFEAATKSKRLEKVFLSTDDPEIIEIAKRDYPALDVPFVRPAHLSDDKSKSVDVALHLLDSISDEPQFLVLLQPTAPLRTAEDIDRAIELMEKNYPVFDSLASLCEVDEPHPYKMKVVKNGTIEPLIEGTSSEIARQELPTVYRLNGALYITEVTTLRSRKSFFGKSFPMVMDRARSINIDSPEDIELLSYRLQKGR